MDVDKLLELSHGNRDVVKTEKDWEVVFALLRFFHDRWPDEFNDFKSQIPDIRGSRRAGGKSAEGNLMYVGALPPRFIRLIRTIFPLQQFDKKFIWKIVKKIPLFKVAGVNNLSKGTIII